VIALGIDTGGTYTDAALVDQTTSAVLAGAKALTTRHDLAIGIREAIQGVLAACQNHSSVSPSDISLVGLSSTLATNAIVEGQGCPVCLLLVGYDPALIERNDLERELATRDIVYIAGGHDATGNQVAPLDEAAVRDAVMARKESVEAFAVSSYFGVRNPAHELRVRALVQELTWGAGRPEEATLAVTCGHELTSRLDAMRRAITVTLNARLIPLLRELIATVRQSLDGLGIRAPLMIVKGDGSLVCAEWAMQRPVETVLSGPAASVVGAWHLADRRDVWVVDVGGTTTDIAALRSGRPRLNPEGARVGHWQTMVEAADVHTVGLGGDSQVRLDGVGFPGSDGLIIGPRRVVPLSLLAAQHPAIVDDLREQLNSTGREGVKGQYLLGQRQPRAGLQQEDLGLLRELASGPRSLMSLVEDARYGPLVLRRVEELEAHRLLTRAGFTPTDALHVLGRFTEWNSQAAQLGAQILARRLHVSLEVFCERVVARVSDQVTSELVSKVLSDEATLPNWNREPSAAAFMARAMGAVSRSDLTCELTLRQPVVAVGAPVEAYLPRTARQLRTELVIPAHAEVANAVGAVAGGVIQRARALVRPMDGDRPFRVHMPDGILDCSTLEHAVEQARHIVTEHLSCLARKAGADHVEVQMERVDRVAPVQIEWGKDVYVETELTFTAAGRPALAREVGVEPDHAK
jgi:N-methylhydantoinase A/oxoprolinase/acetone carboxylase beta subunit